MPIMTNFNGKEKRLIYIYIYINSIYAVNTLNSSAQRYEQSSYIYIYMRDNNNRLPLHSVSWVEPNLQMAL